MVCLLAKQLTIPNASLLLLGPIVVALLAVTGRSTVTVGIVAAYVVSLPAYVLYGSRR